MRNITSQLHLIVMKRVTSFIISGNQVTNEFQLAVNIDNITTVKTTSMTSQCHAYFTMLSKSAEYFQGYYCDAVRRPRYGDGLVTETAKFIVIVPSPLVDVRRTTCVWK